jgi:hypothetical protein
MMEAAGREFEGGTVARGVVEAFADWAQGRPGIEPDVVETLVDLKANLMDDRQPTRWRSGDLGELLLDWLPRKVSADDEWYASVVPTTRAFLTRLHSGGQLHRASAPLSSLLAELDDVAGEFADAVHDPARFGMAKTIFSSAGVELGNGHDPGALEEAIGRFNSLPFMERDAALARFHPALEEDDDEDHVLENLPTALPGVRLAPLSELVESARASVTMRELEQLDRWLAAGRAVTATGVLTLKEARSVQEALGWEDPVTGDGVGDGLFAVGLGESDEPPPRAPRSARDMRRLNDLWTLAMAVGVVDVHVTRAYAGPARPVLRALHEQSPRNDEVVLGLWQGAFDELLRNVPGVGWFGMDPDAVGAAVTHALVAAYEGDDHTVGQLLEEMFDGGMSDGPAYVVPLARQVVGAHLERAFARLADLDAMVLPEGDDDVLSLTPLGVYGLRTLVVSRGGVAPVVEDVVDLPADGAVGQFLIANPVLARELLLEWLAPRERRQALGELLLVAREQPASLRYQLLTLILTLEDVPELLVELCADDSLLGPIVHGVLADFNAIGSLRLDDLDSPEGVDEETAMEVMTAVQGLSWRELDLSPGERDLLVVESVARAVFGLESPVRATDVEPGFWSLLDDVTVLRMAGVPHPEVGVVLPAIATGHPAGRVRKAAKKVMHKRATADR